nr:schwannomin-interacting protein 1-like isoform X2 [Penaeus vannamei]
MFGNIINQLKPQKTKDLDEVDGSSNSLSRLPTNLSLSSVSLNSIKSQTAKVSSQLFTSLKSQSDRVSKLIWNEPSEVNDNSGNDSVSPEPKKYPTLLEQLKWPVLVNNRKYWLPYINNDKTDEEDIVEKFIRVIRSEDDDERPQETFYNHPERRRNDREEIRRKLAMGVDDDQFMERPYRKPSLHSRLQSGMNLQICFMNETASDCESQCSDTESTQDREIETDRVSTSSSNSKASTPQPTRTRTSNSESDIREKEVDFFARQAQLQAEARLALAQAKEMARMQMEIEKQQKKKSPIAEIVRESFHKIGVPFPDSKRRISRQILTDMNVAQLQVIANDLHTQIESLNEDLVTLLMERDDLHMEQDSMLVDIEDLTKHIGAKELSLQRSTDSKDETKTSWTTSPAPRNKSNSMRLKIKK